MIRFTRIFPNKRAILFHIDEEARDTITAKSFLKVCNKKGYLTIFSSRLTAKLYKFFRIDKFIDNILIPKPYFINNYTKDYKSKIFSLLPTEALGHICYSKISLLDHFIPFGNNISFEKKKKISDLITLHFLWGSEVERSIKEITPIKNAKLFTIGHPRYYGQNIPKTKKKIKKISLDRKLKIGFSSRFDSLNSYNFKQSNSLIEAIIFNDSCMKWLSEKEISSGIGITERLYKDIQDLRNMFHIIESIRDNDLFEISFRPHPREDINNWEKISQRYKSKNLKWCLNITNQSFLDWLSNLDVLISPPSTTFYECLFLGVFPISTDKLVKGRDKLLNYHWDDSNKINKHIQSPSSIESIKILLDNIIKNYNSYIPNFWTQEKIQSINGEVDIKKSKQSIEIIVNKIDQEIPRHKLGNLRFLYIYLVIFLVESIGLFGNICLKINKLRSSSYWFFSIKEHIKIHK